MNETDTVGLNTQAVLQWTRLLMSPKLLAMEVSPANFAYKQGGTLADFSDWASTSMIPGAKE